MEGISSHREPHPTRRGFLGACAVAGVALAAGGATGTGEETVKTSDAQREGWLAEWLKLLGPFPETKPPLEPAMKRVGDIDGIECHYVTYQTEPGERVPGYLLVPESAKRAPGPAMFCLHPTTRGSGKRRTVGLSGAQPTDPPDPPETSRAYALELARWGYVTFTIDQVCDGERIPEGLPRYDTRAFYARHPEWSPVGKTIWDTMRGIDFLETLDFVDPSRIGCVGHSLGGHGTVFASAFDERIACGVANGGVLSWVRDTDHWSRDPANRGAVSAYIYIRKFRPYVEDPLLPVPIDFGQLIKSVAPRPLLVMCTEQEAKRDSIVDTLADAGARYRSLGGGDRLALFTYPGAHNYPPDAKRFSFAWLDRWLDHTPAVPTIWPGTAV